MRDVGGLMVAGLWGISKGAGLAWGCAAVLGGRNWVCAAA
jgi:hypothetical protein